MNKEIEDKTYRIYVTDGLKMLSGNTSRPHGGETYTVRYIDVIDNTPQEERSAEEVISDIRNKLEKLGG